MTTILSSLIDIFAQAFVVLYPPVLAFWLIIHSNIEYWRTVGKRAYGAALLAWPAISLPILYARATLFSRRWPTPWWIVAIGVLSLCLAARTLSLAWRVIPTRTLVGLPEIEPRKNIQPLLETGIYARTRNPVYVAHFLLIVSAAALSGFAANWALVALDTLLLPVMVRTEERELEHRYGAIYAGYMRRVPRFLPKWPR